jgi:hypothetical protein
VRSHTSRMHVMGEAQHSFGKDVAWKEAHYEDPGPLPVFRGRPSSSQPKMSRSTPHLSDLLLLSTPSIHDTHKRRTHLFLYATSRSLP